MKRKVIQIAGSTQLISLPRKWAKRYNVQKGDELGVEEQGSKIVVSTETEGESLAATIKIPKSENFLRRSISTLYKMGYDEVEVQFEQAAVLEKVQEEMEELLGFEVVNQTKSTCTIRNVASGLEEEFDSILRRLFLMMRTTAQDSYEAIRNKNYDALPEISRREKTNDRLTIFCQRMINKKGYKDHKRTSLMYALVSQLEQIGDVYGLLSMDVYERRPRISKETLELYNETNELLEMFYDLFYRFTIEKLVPFKKKRMKIEKSGFDLLLKKPKDEISTIHYTLRISDKLHHATEHLS